MKKPNLFILGAPKCGTTSMDEWLRSHPNIFMAKKEPHYFNTDHKNHNVANLAAYQALFDDVSEQHQVIGETSVRYLYSKTAVANILNYSPDAKFVVMLRNPIEMAYSWHGQVCFSRLESVKNFEKAWHLQTARQQGYKIPKGCVESSMLFYGQVCSLGMQLQNLYRQVPIDRVHLVLFDDLKKDPKKTYQALLNFLNIADDKKQVFTIHNAAKVRRFGWFMPSLLPLIANLLISCLVKLKTTMQIKQGFGISQMLVCDRGKTKKRPPLSPQMKQVLIEYFSKDIALLSKTIHRDLSSWTK